MLRKFINSHINTSKATERHFSRKILAKTRHRPRRDAKNIFGQNTSSVLSLLLACLLVAVVRVRMTSIIPN